MFKTFLNWLFGVKSEISGQPEITNITESIKHEHKQKAELLLWLPDMLNISDESVDRPFRVRH